jgi:hypothetical protein
MLDGPDIAALRAWRVLAPGARVTVFRADGSVSLVQLSFGGRQTAQFPTAQDAATAVALPGGVFADVPSAPKARGRGWRGSASVRRQSAGGADG